MAVRSMTDNAVTEAQKKENYVLEILKNMAKTSSGILGMTLLTLHILMALLAPYITPHDPLHIPKADEGLKLAAPSSEYWFGNDSIGRDVLSRTMMGGRVALLVTITGTVIAIAWSSIAGMFLGVVGGRIDEIVMRVVDAIQAIPWLLFLLLIVSIVGTEIWVLIITLGFFFGISPMRIFRNATLDFVARDFVLAAKARGEGMMTILSRELLPNILDIILVEGAMRWSWMLLAFSSLTFLGFGVAPPTPDWGLMISNAIGVMANAPWWTFTPVVALSSMIIGINLTADALAKATGLDRAQGAPV